MCLLNLNNEFIVFKHETIFLDYMALENSKHGSVL